jgi:YidC/Oxa1 family membrane protein insertase
MSPRSVRLSARPRWLALALLFGLLALAMVACEPLASSSAPGSPGNQAAQQTSPAAAGANASPQPATSPTPAPTPEPEPLQPASLGADPFSLLNWAFTPIFWLLFLILAELYALSGNVLVAIVLLTLLVRLVTVRLSSRQIVSSWRMMRLQPELRVLQKELQRRYKGDRQAIYAAQQAFYKERGVSPTAGCLPSILQMGMLIPMYAVIRIGLTNYDPSTMLGVFGVKLVPLTCPNPAHVVDGVLDKSLPCINTVIAGIDMGKEQVLFNLPLGFFTLGISVLALIAAFLQLIQSRMMMPPPAENDPSASTSRSMMVLLPLFSILYGGILPAGLFIYWIVSSLFSIVQQFLIIGWGQLFPLFGWTPAFAQGYTPRYPVTMPEPTSTGKSLASTRQKQEDRWVSAASTVRPNTRRRSGRRGRRR